MTDDNESVTLEEPPEAVISGETNHEADEDGDDVETEGGAE